MRRETGRCVLRRATIAEPAVVVGRRQAASICILQRLLHRSPTRHRVWIHSTHFLGIRTHIGDKHTVTATTHLRQHIQTMFLLLFNCLMITVVTSQERFRSILIERACRQRPSLSFCSDFESPRSPKAVAESELVIPPEIPPKEGATSTEATATVMELSSVASTSEADEVDSENSTHIEEHLGSLLRLPKPKRASEEPLLLQPLVPIATEAVRQSENAENSSVTSADYENEKTVLVFVSEYCVVQRERFVKKCHGDVMENEIPFCKTYPSACAATNGVIPVITYCQRYYRHYPKFCTDQRIEQDVLQFCFAFEQFCLPELTPAQPVQRPQSSLRKCEDVLPEARKVCNPFPHPKDTFNVLRCSNFLTNCKRFVDWV